MERMIAQHFRMQRYWLEIAGQVPVYAGLLLTLLLTAVIVSQNGMPFPFSNIYTNLDLYPKGFFLFLIVDGTIQLARNRPDSPVSFLWARYSAPPMIALFFERLPLLLVLLIFLPVFALLKPMIPVLHPYEWDLALTHWDRAIFFGVDPWRILQPVLGYPIVTAALAVSYHAWFGLVYPGGLVLLYAKHAEAIRRQYFLSFMLVWIVGGFLLAALLSSVGPCFMEPLLGNAHFAEQMAYLHQANERIPIVVLDVQAKLLNNYLINGPGHGLGITAMPSMHVAMAFLFFLGIRHVSPLAGRIFFGFFVLIWVASVHLGYHYALDGLVSVILTWAVWRASAALITWWDRVAMPALAKSTPSSEIPVPADC